MMMAMMSCQRRTSLTIPTCPSSNKIYRGLEMEASSTSSFEHPSNVAIVIITARPNNLHLPLDPHNIHHLFYLASPFIVSIHQHRCLRHPHHHYLTTTWEVSRSFHHVRRQYESDHVTINHQPTNDFQVVCGCSKWGVGVSHNGGGECGNYSSFTNISIVLGVVNRQKLIS